MSDDPDYFILEAYSTDNHGHYQIIDVPDMESHTNIINGPIMLKITTANKTKKPLRWNIKILGNLSEQQMNLAIPNNMTSGTITNTSCIQILFNKYNYCYTNEEYRILMRVTNQITDNERKIMFSIRTTLSDKYRKNDINNIYNRNPHYYAFYNNNPVRRIPKYVTNNITRIKRTDNNIISGENYENYNYENIQLDEYLARYKNYCDVFAGM